MYNLMLVMLLLSAVIIGLSLGLLGAGGSILTVPALTLFLGMDEKTAVTSSLIIVGLIALVGALKAFRQRELDKRLILSFGLVSLPFAALGARLGLWMPAGGQTLLLVAVMLIVAFKMLRNKASPAASTASTFALLAAAAVVGVITGIVGVGGGFLIVPALVVFAGVSMRIAIANSLALIVINAITAFLAISMSNQSPILDWVIILTMAGVGAIAVLAGQGLASRLPQQLLKRGFALILLGLSIWLIADQIIMRYM
jgi:uncharacterized membrane protein YfcA